MIVAVGFVLLATSFIGAAAFAAIMEIIRTGEGYMKPPAPWLTQEPAPKWQSQWPTWAAAIIGFATPPLIIALTS